MNTPSISILLLLFIFSCTCPPSSADPHDAFLECLSHHFQDYNSISSLVYTTKNSSYSSILNFSIRNLRFASESTPKPLVIMTVKHETQIPPFIYCAKNSSLEIRIRSGGYDFEGLSYVSRVPFVILDLINLSEISVDVEEKTAWVGAGATIGSLYYKIAEKSPVLGFPSSVIPSVSVGGLISGGGFGVMLRKHGLSADHVIDARIIDVHGRILDRESMDADLFWAIRGGGGASFGVIIGWKVQLVDVPRSVTVFSIDQTSEQNMTQLIHRWQYVAPQLDKDLYIGVFLNKLNYPSSQEGRNATIRANFYSLFLGGVDRLMALMEESFPELGLVKEDCAEMSWIQSIVYFSRAPILPKPSVQHQERVDVLLNGTQPNLRNVKIKIDYVQNPIPETGLQGIERLLYEPEAKECLLSLVPYSGKMSEISESATPFPHRAGNLYKVESVIFWNENEAQDTSKYISWSRRYYSYMTPYVSSFPRAAYFNCRDLDNGVNNPDGNTSYAEASNWGKKYFKNNFDRHVQVKTVVDPNNFLKNEQSIPPLY